jgi:putative transposase
MRVIVLAHSLPRSRPWRASAGSSFPICRITSPSAATVAIKFSSATTTTHSIAISSRRPAGARGVAVWAYRLMPDHVDLILTPRTPEGLGRALGKAHRRTSAFVNARMRVTGHLFQARFSSVAMDEDHLMAAARYPALNPVRAKLVAQPEDWPWSSVWAHLAGCDDRLVEVAPLLERCGGRFADLLAEKPDPAKIAALRAAETIGRPLGAGDFLDRLAALTGRDLQARAQGARRKRRRREGRRRVERNN